MFDRDLAADALAAVVGAFTLGWLSSEAVFLGAFLGGTMSRLVRVLVRRWKTRTIWQLSGGFGLWDIWHLVRAPSHAAGAAGEHTGAGAAAQGLAVVAASACAAGALVAAQPILPDPLRPPDGTPRSVLRAGTLQVGGEPVRVAIERPGQHATLTFRGRKGDRLTAFASDVQFGRAGSTRVTVWEPSDQDGQPLMTGEVDATSGEVDDSVTLPDTGTYTVLVEPEDAATGSLDLRLPRTR